MSLGGEFMNYQALLKIVALEYNTTPEEVESEIKEAIRAAGYDDVMTPELFISLIVAKVRKDYIS